MVAAPATAAQERPTAQITLPYPDTHANEPPSKPPREEPPPLKGLPDGMSPRQRMLHAGAHALSGTELIAVLLGGPERRALGTAAEVLDAVHTLNNLARDCRHDLQGIEYLGEAGTARLLAAAELGRRIATSRPPKRPEISTPADVDTLLRGRLANLDREHFIVVLLNTKNRVIGSPTVSIGTLSSSLVHPREVFKPAIKAGAARVILVHNHPSGDATPSTHDRQITRQMTRAGELVEIEVLDHVILGDDYMSLKEAGGM